VTEPLALLWSLLGAGRGFHCFRLNDWDGQQVHLWREVSDRARFEGTVQAHAWTSDLEISARPYCDRGSFRLQADAGCIWARAETGRQAVALAAFPVEPTLVLREGSSPRHTAFWAVRKPLSPEDGEKVNRHLAHRLRTAKKHAAQLFFAPPGAVIRSGKRPVPVVVAGGSGEVYGVRRLCLHMPRTIPSPDAWRNAAAR
jgi:hypothetical protein